MEKPSRKIYPDYYAVIEEPIDLMTIKANVENDKYNSTEELVKDFNLMFNNCRQYNEEGSLIYSDANQLQKVMNEKLKDMGGDPALKLKQKK